MIHIKRIDEMLDEFISESFPTGGDNVIRVFGKNVKIEVIDPRGVTFYEFKSMIKRGLEPFNAEEIDYITEHYDCVWDNERNGLLIDGRIFIPETENGFGEYWISDFMGPDDSHMTFTFDSENETDTGYENDNERCGVLLFRYI